MDEVYEGCDDLPPVARMEDSCQLPCKGPGLARKARGSVSASPAPRCELEAPQVSQT